MGAKIKKIMHRHYPAANLPEDLWEGIPLNTLVTVTIEREEQASLWAPKKPALLPAEKSSDRDGQ
ncbi:hypothetical protein ACNHKD_13135 [Methylocystis sp. JAN1]|uniref:hypothetical protein n=1 Tax=Methylocystis sp. JAN1 TaxID=3397211 RepID=UPI003FA33014